MKSLQKPRQKPDGEQLKESGDDQTGWMYQAVGKRLPDGAMQESCRIEDQIGQCGSRRSRGEQPHNGKQEIGAQVYQHQSAGGAVKIGECKRCGANPCHRTEQVKWNALCVSWGPVSQALTTWTTQEPLAVVHGTTTSPRWPFASTARTPKMTLSLEMGSDTVTGPSDVVAGTCFTYCQLDAVVSRQSTS